MFGSSAGDAGGPANGKDSPHEPNNGLIRNEQRYAFMLTLFMVVLLVAGALNGVWMTWNHIRVEKENRAMMKAQSDVMVEMKKEIDIGRRDVERNRIILEARTPIIEQLVKNAELQRRAIENLNKELDQLDSIRDWKRVK